MFKRTRISAATFCAISGLVLLADGAWAQQSLERVEITGSSIRRVDAETALPVTIIKAEDLAKQGVTTAEQAVQRITSNQSNFGVTSSVGGTTGGKAEADLRGLSGPTGSNSNKTLILLNGRRLANHSFDAAAVDLNAIPLSAISRIEVLRDGASSTYGTDAIAGVINFILRRDFTGVDISAEAQKPQASGGGDTKRFSLTGGVGSLSEQRFNLLGSLDYRKQNVLLAADREFSKTGILLGRVTQGTSGTSFPGDVNGFEPSLPGCAAPNSVPNPAGTACRYDFSRAVDAIPENEGLTGLLRGSFAITPQLILSAEYLRARSELTAQVAPAPVSHLIPATSPFYPAGAPTTAIDDINGGPQVQGGVVNWRQVPGGKRTSGNVTITDRKMIDLEGSIGSFDYKTAIGRSENKSTESVKKGYLNDDIMQEGVWNGVINPFGDQTAAGAAFIETAQVKAPTQIGKNKVDFFDYRASVDLAELPAGPLSMAVGVDYRKENSGFVATDITASLGSLGIDPDSDTSGSRKSKGVFVEFGIPILKGLDLTMAGRYDKYSDFGNTFNPKVALRFQPMKELVLRGSFNSGFRAPTLYEIYQPASLTFTSDNYNDPLLCPGGTAVAGASAGVVCDQQVLQRNAGPSGIGKPASTLQPEKARNFTLGFVADPAPWATVGVDLWRVKIKNLINGLPEQAVFGNVSKYASRFVRCSALPATGAGISRDDIDACLNTTFDPIAYIDTPTENLGELHTSGVDLSVQFKANAGQYGNFALGIESTYVDKYKYQRERGGEFINAAGAYSDNAPVFRWQHVFTLNWNVGSWSLTAVERMKSGYTDQDPSNYVSEYTVHDLSVAYTGIKGLSIMGGMYNVFNEKPPQSVQVTTFQRGYDPRFTDPRGRTFALRIGYKY